MKEKRIYSTSFQVSHYTLRKWLGILGVTLPFVLWFGSRMLGQPTLAPSISHYYYSKMTVYFTGVLCAFGLYLFAYRGYKKKNDEYVSDNLVTNIAGFLAILTALIPTECCNIIYCGFHCTAANAPVNGSSQAIIHLMCAGAFLIIMGGLSIFKFTRINTDKRYKRQKRLAFIWCGGIVWAAIVFLVIDMFLLSEPLGYHDVFWAETIALIAFGASWLIKSKEIDPLMAFVVAKLNGKSTAEIFSAK